MQNVKGSVYFLDPLYSCCDLEVYLFLLVRLFFIVHLCSLKTVLCNVIGRVVKLSFSWLHFGGTDLMQLYY